MTFNLQYGKVLSIAFCSRVFISNDFLLRNWKANHFHFKDVLPKKFCSDIVYSFKRNSWNAIYYGKKTAVSTSEQLDIQEYRI